VTTGLFGGAFDPPHDGHVALATTAIAHFHFERLVVLVTGDPPHKGAVADKWTRLGLAEAALGGIPGVVFDPFELERDGPSYTVDTVRWAAERWRDPIFLIGADEFAEFLAWREPNEVLAAARLGVATRPGYPRTRLDAVLAQLDRPERVTFFEIPAFPISSRELRARLASGESIDAFVPARVAALIEGLALYRCYAEASDDKGRTAR
jgi:nicotinate-nucleotide adenylyltransferase